MSRTVVLTLTLALGIAAMGAAHFGTFGASVSAQQKPAVPIIVTRDSAEVLTLDFGTARILASQALTNGSFGVIDAVQQPGHWTPLHQHKFEESFLVIEGTMTVEIGGETREVPAGSYVWIPGGVPHAQGNRGKVPMRNIVTTHPTGLEMQFRRRAEEFRQKNLATPK